METAFMTWCVVVTLICAVVLTRLIMAVSDHHSSRYRKVRRIHILRKSNESEMFYVPGDAIDSERYDNDYDSED